MVIRSVKSIVRSSSVILIVLILGSCQIFERTESREEYPRSMKGYELYSWKEGESWKFSLLTGTNRIKLYEEIRDPTYVIDGIENLQKELVNLSPGESLFWISGRVPGVELPPTEVIETIRKYCSNANIELYIVR